MKKAILLLLLGASWVTGLKAQDKCMTMPVLKHHIEENPAVQSAMERAEQDYYHWRKSGQKHPDRVVYTIPTVVHVVYTSAADNISDAQVLSQLKILNQDYRRLNPDTVNTRAIFDTLAADVGIEFCLATKDPDGNPTTGITRTQGNPGFLGFFDPISNNIKSTANGGKDPWPRNDYLNIWVCPLFPIVLGYAQFPWDAPATDGVVIGYTAFGDMGAVQAPSTGGRTTVHEVGHWLGLRHIWGDGDCTATDSVMDTPNADAASQTDCNLNRNTCVESPFDYPDMVENYMDYSTDACMNMFTLGQKDRMLYYLTTWRAGLLTSDGCSFPPLSVKEELSQQITVFPNPATDQVRLSVPASAGHLLGVKVFDVMGKEVKMPLQGNLLNFSGQAAGVFILEIETEKGRIAKKIIAGTR